jgi:ubiquitin carboxyl-terminal hydrolase 8
MVKQGCTGLTNLGNTCFMNSCIQVLNQTHELTNLIQAKKGKTNRISDSVIFREWAELQELMSVNTGIISPNKFVHHVQELAKEKKKDIFTGWSQNDMPEYLLFMMECFHNSISRKVKMNIIGKEQSNTDKMAITCYEMLKNVFEKEYSEIMETFYAIYVSEITSIDGRIVHTMKPEMFFILDLPVPNEVPGSPPISLYDCFDEFLKPEILEGENAWMNESTGVKENIQKRITFWNLPKILVIMLKRTCPLGQQKNRTNVEFPIEGLDLSSYIRGYSPHKYVYDLYGVCYHHGGVHGGHYTCNVKNKEGEWIHFNDTNYEVLESTSTIVNHLSYCLFYRQRT